MTIKTKFEIGDKVFTIDKKTLKVLRFEVSSICASINSYGNIVHLYPKEGSGVFYDEKLCFDSEEKLIQYVTDYGDHKELF